MFQIVPTTSEAIAKNACAYARHFIKMGSTQLVNNEYTILQKHELQKYIAMLRKACRAFPDYTLELDKEIQHFYQTIELCKKLSLGNCHELALMALDYVVNYTPPQTNAEVYHIKGGDHVFLVVGRKKDSIANQPETWGDQAYICDPWANEVYPASDYLSRTKNYYRVTDKTTGNFTNHTEDFNPSKHSLNPIKDSNASYIREAHSEKHIEQVMQIFETKTNLILKAMDQLEQNLLKIADKIEQKHGEYDDKRAVILKLISNIQAARIDIQDNLNNRDNKAEYLALRSLLENKLKGSLSHYSRAVQMSKEDKAILSRYRDGDSLKSRMQSFLNIAPETVSKTTDALEESQNEITNAINLGR
ncbi:hypothetical protein [Legionella sp. 16cNR16C]|uniref:hypothetical protein n=1 Tax=Legionella sp. 16cNR16C TaxID=2905656 RepID=UPI001E625AC8|nr:hypothetical protein [Legionella sp. 16cNR16C]MCE3044918.1 hypothetical protein [Legionella sp. 16cNR16C]